MERLAFLIWWQWSGNREGGGDRHATCVVRRGEFGEVASADQSIVGTSVS
ncbi:hypothetical protein trd_A0845 (plasmid) [Thermomicrobium roseum DSM 5159]|uniref:Uncharacterized protein n=1 Tax=Thermomicrobium roseum (strain ATCC 27502 / DSM 5159 / P-2) TaxID=309801 RepID=B9L4Y1_THERP|nr:hypothetical protein trd_A0845 [Thermomicrobium roseum DSM 5159]